MESADKPVEEKNAAVDLAVVHCPDTGQWARYVQVCLAEEYPQLNLALICLPVSESGGDALLSDDDAQTVLEAHGVLLMISPQMLRHPPQQTAELWRCTPGFYTVAMLCGVPDDLPAAVKPWARTWGCTLQARDNDHRFACDLLTATIQVARRPVGQPFKVAPRKVTQSNNKVHAMFQEPPRRRQTVVVRLDGIPNIEGCLDLAYEWINPYTLMFKIPESCFQTSRLVNIEIQMEGKSLGHRSLKCESRMMEAYSVLRTESSPYEFLCRAFGLCALSEVDDLLTSHFRARCPRTGLSLLDAPPRRRQPDLVPSNGEFLPTLLHLSCHYGLPVLTSALLEVPGARQALNLPNCEGLTPLHLATKSDHLNIVKAINQFQSHKPSPKETPRPPSEPVKYESMHEEFYDHPKAPKPVPKAEQSPTEDNHYLEMIGKKDFESLPPHMKILIGTADKCKVEESLEVDPCDSEYKQEGSLTHCNVENICLPANQTELIEIMAAVKNGSMPIEDAEAFFHEWQERHRNTLKIDPKDTINELRDLYKAAKKSNAHLPKFIRCFLPGFRAPPSSKHGGKSLTKSSKKSDDQEARPISLLSTTSSTGSSGSDRSSTVSLGSSCDSGNHSDDLPKSKILPPPPAPPQVERYVKPAPAPPPRLPAPAPVEEDPIYYNTTEKLEYANPCGQDYDVPPTRAPAGEFCNMTYLLEGGGGGPEQDYDFPKSCTIAMAPIKPPPKNKSPMDYYDIPRPFKTSLPYGNSPSRLLDVNLDDIPQEPPPPPPRMI